MWSIYKSDLYDLFHIIFMMLLSAWKFLGYHFPNRVFMTTSQNNHKLVIQEICQTYFYTKNISSVYIHVIKYQITMYFDDDMLNNSMQ